MIITLTTDFGLKDPYVGIMKGVILGIAPSASIVDITHAIRSYDIDEAAFLVMSARQYFPAGTVHVVVVDPGVGSARRPIAAEVDAQTFVAPDNGVLSFMLAARPAEPARVHHITSENLFRKPVSRTFHGRDIFAPAAAHLAAGTPLEAVGPRIRDFVRKPFPEPVPAGREMLRGRVLHTDKFGNLVTNFRSHHLRADFVLRIGAAEIRRRCETFSDAEPGEVVVVEGSTGFIEVVMNNASAAGRLGAGNGSEIELETRPSNY